MNHYYGGAGFQKHAPAPGAGQRTQRRPVTSAPQYPQVVQATQSFGIRGPVSTSHAQDQRYNSYMIPRSPAPAYGSATNIRPGHLSAGDRRKLWDAVDSRSTFQPIDEFMLQAIRESIFYDRFDITTEILKNHAWSGSDDWALLNSGITQNARHDGLIRIAERLEGYVFPSRSLEEIWARFEYVMAKTKKNEMKNPPARSPIQDGGQSIYDTQSCIPGFPTANPNNQAPGSYSFRLEAASQSPGAGSSWTGQHHNVPTMPEVFRGYEWQDQNVPHMAPETSGSEEYEDDDDSEMESPILSDTECDDDGLPQMLPQTMLDSNLQDHDNLEMSSPPFFDNDWEDFQGHHMRPRNSSYIEVEDYDYPQMSPQSMLNTNIQDYNDLQLSPSVFLDPELEDPGNPQLSPLSARNTEWQDHGVRHAATQELNDDYNPQATPQTSLSPRSDGREHIDNGAGHAGGTPPGNEPSLSPGQIQDIKVKYAGGMTVRAITEQFYRGRILNTVQHILRRSGWAVWSCEQDMKVRQLHDKHLDNWALISAELAEFPGARRNAEEVEARVGYLKGRHGGGPKRYGWAVQRNAGHEYESDDDEYITWSRTQDVPYSQMIKDRFESMSVTNLETHAHRIGATWGPKNDQKLKEMVGNGMEVDWDSCAAEYEPPRSGEILKARWEYLKTKKQSSKKEKRKGQ